MSGGQLATLNACVTMTTPTEAVIAGDKGHPEDPHAVLPGPQRSRWASTS